VSGHTARAKNLLAMHKMAWIPRKSVRIVEELPSFHKESEFRFKSASGSRSRLESSGRFQPKIPVQGAIFAERGQERKT